MKQDDFGRLFEVDPISVKFWALFHGDFSVFLHGHSFVVAPSQVKKAHKKPSQSLSEQGVQIINPETSCRL